jgi:vacuolar protein sorting-associated protein 13A/C
VGIDWTGSLELTTDLEEFKAINMESDGHAEGQSKQLSLSIYICQKQSMDLYIYSPYWILNKTMLPIQLRVSMFL